MEQVALTMWRRRFRLCKRAQPALRANRVELALDRQAKTPAPQFFKRPHRSTEVSFLACPGFLKIVIARPTMNAMPERASMEVDIVCVGFGPATAGFLHTLTQHPEIPAMQAICYERAEDIGFGVSG